MSPLRLVTPVNMFHLCAMQDVTAFLGSDRDSLGPGVVDGPRVPLDSPHCKRLRASIFSSDQVDLEARGRSIVLKDYENLKIRLMYFEKSEMCLMYSEVVFPK